MLDRPHRSMAVLIAILVCCLASLTALPGAAVTDHGPGAPGGTLLKGSSWTTVRADPQSTYTRSGPLVPPTAEAARRDQPAYYADSAQGGDDGEGCHVMRPRSTPIGCSYGQLDSSTDLWLLGSSKTGQWADPLVRIAERESWKVTVHTKSGCPFTPGVAVTDYPECDAFNATLLEEVAAASPEIVAFAPSWHPTVSDYSPQQQDDVIDDLLGAGVRHVVVLWESPAPTRAAVACVEKGPVDYRDCTYRHADGGSQRLNRAAAERADHDASVTYLDLSEWVCPGGGECPAVVGGVQVTGKGSHLTASYTRTLVDPLHAQLTQAGIARIRADVLPSRIEGIDRYGTAVAAARQSPAGDRSPIYLTTGEDWPDAVAAAGLGVPSTSRAGARVLLTKGDRLSPVNRSVLEGASEVILVGETDVLSRSVEEAVRSMGLPVSRVGGAERYSTAARLALKYTDPPSTVNLATGVNWPDATVAAAEGPTLLTRPDKLPTATRNALRTWADDGLRSVVLLGDRTAVSLAVEREVHSLGLQVVRAGGANRYATAVEFALHRDRPAERPVFVTGTAWPDAVSSSQLGSAVFLTKPDALPSVVSAALGQLPGLNEPRIVGGPAAVSSSVEGHILDHTAPGG